MPAAGDLEGRIAEAFDQLSPKQQTLARLILDNRYFASFASAAEIADPSAMSATPANRQTLGLLVGQMMGSFIVVGEPESPADLTDGEPAVEFRVRIGLRPEDFAKVEADLRDLVALRHRLVHSFLEDHELCSPAGCETALSALDEASTRTEKALAELRVWAGDLERSLSVAAQVLNSTGVRDALTRTAIPWPVTTIVQALREAERALARDGWAPVPQAAEWISKHYPGERPDGYLCRSWRQVVHESRLFELRYRTLGDGRREAWYRSRIGTIGAR